ncbi:hypothetical protein [Prochlorococcus sp. MIT 1307]|uniref:hypothetical protein n=1 Tax=Prochlorococcus sp. MIT 1307 TaxID=3096219 RepID=UPI002A74BC77|nr:hypothetical protein [Prochlorococcus sp. MIT 1307]
MVLSESGKANQLIQSIQNAGIALVRCDLIQPRVNQDGSRAQKPQETSTDPTTNNPSSIASVEIDTVELLTPNLSKKLRQRKMSMLLMPFGFIAGLTFTQMTGLTTFSDFGVGALGEPLSGGLVGMASGWMGSHVAAASVSSKNEEDITSLRKLSEQGEWLLLLETPFEVELPWKLLKEIEPLDIVRLIDQ